MNPSNNNRNSGRQPETPQRVANAAEQMRNTATSGAMCRSRREASSPWDGTLPCSRETGLQDT